jgi:hypothetical protein
METFNVVGCVVNSETKQGIAGLKVEAWDKDLILDDLLGIAVTDDHGSFKIDFSESSFRDLVFFERKPDLFFKLFLADELVASTENSVLWNVSSGKKEIVIEVMPDICTRIRDMKPELEYGPWEIHPQRRKLILPPIPLTTPEMKAMTTMYEGSVTYLKLWNFWVRSCTPATAPTDDFFHNYESGSKQVMALISAVGTPTYWPHTEKDVWNRIETVWNWLGTNVRYDSAAYDSLTSADRWPSIEEFAQYYADNNELVWVACFSKAHLFATLLGRVLPRWHVIIALAHHTENGAPPTASHVYVGVYLTDRWYYLDPTDVVSGPLPGFNERKSVGPFKTVDYQHPFDAIPVPLSPLDVVPHLPA